ncbi:hypothetical protein TEA_000552 [Camellia sinensis var. sinensis]|uniref:Uncharacterized protein n=1 Tax=Camellia sinensis var. sinensis TaxID=542762 RepID=A0A4S4DCM8_CAMSN|nr:hypothetical protein TEA_000552 [Camellia sinensis var. sinensis]
MSSSKVSLKLLIDTKAHKVLFAEAGKDFVDFLFNILSLPVGTSKETLLKPQAPSSSAQVALLLTVFKWSAKQVAHLSLLAHPYTCVGAEPVGRLTAAPHLSYSAAGATDRIGKLNGAKPEALGCGSRATTSVISLVDSLRSGKRVSRPREDEAIFWATDVFSENVVRLKSSVVVASVSSEASPLLHARAILSGELGVIILSVLLLHFAGFFVGYISAAISGFREPQRRAISIEVGMQNSSLGVVLATSHFTSPMVALPPALSAVLMNIMGSSLGFFWRYVDPSDSQTSPKVYDQ